ncbi:hypothetical protein T10_10260 [Trichinella papuae]|uniref:Uncharacterized protein n=1 Tax=Trichinella papuae TaxID=268474 RepID=A0A0V1MSK8_9BILA|nr:hypothetical protein T10_10260 [Trichinella papuae]
MTKKQNQNSNTNIHNATNKCFTNLPVRTRLNKYNTLNKCMHIKQGPSDWSILIRLGAYFFASTCFRHSAVWRLFVRRMKMNATNK